MRDREPQGRTGVISIVDQLERRTIARLRAQAEAMHLREAELSIERFEGARTIKETDYDALLALVAQHEARPEDVRVAVAKLRATRGLQRCLLGDPAAGLAEWAEVIAEAPELSFPYLVRARWTMLEDPAAALVDYDRAAEVEPREPLVYWRRGDCYVALGDQERALANYRRALALDPSSLDEAQTMAKLLAVRGEHAEAARVYDRAIALGPRYADLYQGRAQCREAIGDFEGAARDHGRILEIDPTRHACRYLRAWCLEQAGQTAGAMEELERLVALDPEGARGHRTLGKLRFEAGLPREAVESLTRAVALAPDDPTAHAFLGHAHLLAGDGAGALVAFGRAAELAPDEPGHHLGLALVRTRDAPHEEVLAELDALVARFPDSSLVVERRAGVLLEHGDFALALVDHDHALTLAPDDADLHVGRARSLGPLDRVDEAFASADRAVTLAPGDAVALVLRGVFGHYLDKDPAQVEADYDRAVELAPDDASVLATRAQLRQEMEQHRAAVADYDRAIALAPRSRTLYYERGYSRSRLDEEMWALDEEWEEEREALRARYLACVEDFERAIALGLCTVEVYAELHDAHFARGDLPAALVALDRGLEAMPDAGPLILCRHSLRGILKDPDGAAADRQRGEALGLKFP